MKEVYTLTQKWGNEELISSATKGNHLLLN